jgi:hypothetical protein
MFAVRFEGDRPMSDWYYSKTAKYAQSERLREAQHQRLVDQVMRAQQTKRDPLYAVTLAKIGGWLIASGSYLQANFGNFTDNFKDSISQELCAPCPDDFVGDSYVQAR